MTSTETDTAVRWIFRAGTKRGFTEIERLDNEIAFSFRDLSDLSLLPNSRGAFRKIVAAGYPDLPPSQLPLRISQVYWFVHRMAPGDEILLVDEGRELVQRGTLASRYRYIPEGAPYFNRRSVRWTSSSSIDWIPVELVEVWRAQTGIIPIGLNQLEDF